MLLGLPLELGVNPAAKNNQALRFASYEGYTEIVRLLLDLPFERGIDPCTKNFAALNSAIEEGHTEICALLRQKIAERKA